MTKRKHQFDLRTRRAVRTLLRNCFKNAATKLRRDAMALRAAAQGKK